MKYNLYDFDGTIYDGDSGFDIVMFAISKNPKVLLSLIASLGTVILFLFGLRTKEEAKNKVFSFLKYFPNTSEFVEEFWIKNEHKIKDFWKKKKDHKNDIIISASGYFWLNPIAKKYKVGGLIATEIDPHTGIIKDNNCHGKEKVLRFKEKFPKAIISKMYTDSINDLPLIEEAKEGYLVKKNKIYNYYEYKPNFIVRFWRWGWGIYHKNEELWNYLIVGFLTTVVSVGVKWLLLFTILNADNGTQLQLAIIISWIVAVFFAYFANRIFVFKSKNENILKEMTQFFGARILTLIMEMLIMWFFVTLLKLNTDMWIMIWTIVTQILIIIFNYIFSKMFVFKKK